jgi:hypothetical protein
MICLRRDFWMVLMIATVSHAFVLDSRSTSSNILTATLFRHQQPITRQLEEYRGRRSYHQTRWMSALSTSSDETSASADKIDLPSSVQDLKAEIEKQCDEIGNVDNATKILCSWMDEKYDSSNKDAPMILKSCCKIILQTLIDMEVKAEKLDTVDPENAVPPYLQADKLLTTMISWGKEINSDLLPTADIFELVIKVWISATDIVGASGKCRYYVKKLWSLHEEQSSKNNVDEKRLKLFVPTKQCYEDAIRACSLKDRGVKAAYLADEILNEMESLCADYPQITPDRYTLNKVM